VGLNYHELRELLLAREQGASFDKTLTIGRQIICIHRSEAKRLPVSPPPFKAYGDDFLRELLGISDLQSLDASDFEGASLVHDLNQPLTIDQEFDAVIDGGSLEHVFNTPIALASYMRALKVGGTLFISVPTNNLCGHGFYQFSPELMYRALSEKAGFKVRRMLVVEGRYPSVELTPAKRVLEVADPARVGSRILLASRWPGMLHVRAEKTRHLAEPFADPPQQSDYTARWREGRPGTRRNITQRVPKRLFGLRQRVRFSPYNRRFFRRIT
jgi:SAM-dependent methyltransferase